MAASTRRLNFMIKSELADELESIVPAGMRSKVVNEALSKELDHIRRQLIAEKIERIKKKSPVVSTKEIVAAVRADRGRH
jgi:hypothetical protein